MADIFISFIHEEQGVAKEVQKLLQSQLSIRQVFMSSDPWQVFAGDVWLDKIQQELRPTKVVVLLLSAKSVGRPWINFEAGAAWFSGKPIIPVCYGGVLKSGLPKPYSNFQALDLRAEPNYLVSSVAHHIGVPSPPPFLAGGGGLCGDLIAELDKLEDVPQS